MILLYSLLTINFLLVGINSMANEYFVSLSGSDGEDVSGSLDYPWRTLEHAVGEVRQIRPNPPTAEDMVYITLREGIYYLPSTIALNQRDSHLAIRNYHGEEVAISGGLPLDLDWQRQDGVISGTFPGVCGDAYYGDYRLLKARSPNIAEWGRNQNTGKGPYHYIKDLLVETETCKRNATTFQQECPEEDKAGFIFEDEISDDWENLEQTDIIVFHSWIAEYVTIANISVENGRRKVMFKEPLQHAAVGQWNLSGDWRFLILNNLAVLDMPGEYVCIQDGENAHFSFIPPEDKYETIPILGSLQNVISMNNVNNVALGGINFVHTSFTGKDGYNWKGNSLIKITNSKNVYIRRGEFSHTAMDAIHISRSKNIQIEENTFYDMGYHGVHMMGSEQNDNVMVANNYFDGCGNSRFWQPVCMWIDGNKNISVIHNEITNTANGGIHAGSPPHEKNYWEDNGVTEPTREDYLIHVEFNYVHDFGQGILSDYGAIKTGSQGNCIDKPADYLNRFCHTYIHVYNNLIHDGRAYKVGANHLYSDAASSRTTFENNIMYGTGDRAIIHHCGVDNISKNNIIHRTAEEETQGHGMEIMWGGCEKRKTGNSPSLSNYNNIYLMDNSNGFSFYRNADLFGIPFTEFSQNLYWSLDSQDKEKEMFPYKQDWNGWIMSGNDSDSLWSDPMFEDPNSRIYVLAEDSPAWSLGIQQIDVSKFGIQK